MGAINGVWMGLLMGIVANLVGFFKHKKMEKFEPRELVTKLLIGAIIGAIAGWQGLTYERVEAWMATFGLIEGIDHLIKMIWRRFFKKEEKTKSESQPENSSESKEEEKDKPQEETAGSEENKEEVK